MTKTLGMGLALGLMAGLIDCIIYVIMSGGIGVTLITGLQGVLFWTGVGLTVHCVVTPLPSWVHGAVLTLFLNIPWIMEFSFNQQIPGVAPVMIALALALGGAMGLASHRLRTWMA